jgi:hypothetical protein
MTSRIDFISTQIVAASMLCLCLCLGASPEHAQEQVAAGIGSGTAVVVIRSPKSIYAAVDSKLTYREYRDGELSVTNTLLCKMKPVGPYYSIVAGAVRGTNGYNAQEEIARAYAPGRGIDEMLSALQALVPEKLVPMFQTMRDIDPDTFDSNLAGAELEVALIGMDHNTPKVGIVEFHATDENGQVGLTAKMSTCPGNCPRPTVGYFLGTHEAIEASIRTDNSVLSHPSEEKLEQLIRLEFASHPDIVGGPVAMIRISAAGSSVLREGACAADNPAEFIVGGDGAAAADTTTTQSASAPAADAGSAKVPPKPSKPSKVKDWIMNHKVLVLQAATGAL